MPRPSLYARIAAPILTATLAAVLGATPLSPLHAAEHGVQATAIEPVAAPVAATVAAPASAPVIAPYQARFGRGRPVIAVIGENRGTELTDFVIPYSVLRRAGVAEVLAVATQEGPLTMRPAMRIAPDAAIGQFDMRYPDGADYVIVPAMVHFDDPALLQWLAAQAAKGATLVSICDGALALANSGVMKGRRGTAHWATEGYRKAHYPETEWVANARYVADGKVVSSAGISAALPVSLALVEAIAGTARAAALAGEMAVDDWSAAHDSAPFHPRFGVNLAAHATRYTNPLFHGTDQLGVPVADGVDEFALALTLDAWSRTGRSRAYAMSGADGPVRTLNGLSILPDTLPGALRVTVREGAQPDRLLTADTVRPGKVFGRVLDGIAQSYGKLTAYRVALDFEYPGYP
jgi:putative intracellular protease/amidase